MNSLTAAFDTSRHGSTLPDGLPEVMAAETLIARMDEPDWLALQGQRRDQPDDPWVNLWSGLVLAHRGDDREACGHWSRAIENGCTHWRIGWYIAQAARRMGELDLVDQACAAVLKANPEFWFAREFPKHARGYYAQKDQDRVIESYFERHPARSKVFVEVGAFDGTHYSNVRRLVERHGWTGISIEPVGKNFEKLVASYAGTGVRCVRACVSERDGDVEMNVSTYPHLPEWGSDVASLSPEGMGRWQTRYGAVWGVEKVPARRLTAILEEQGVSDIDLLSVDAEGHDLEVVRSLDLERYRPRLIVVEYGERRAEILDHLHGHRYALLEDNRQDLFLFDGAAEAAGGGQEDGFTPAERKRIVSAAGCRDGDDVTLKLNPHLVGLGTLPLDGPVRRSRVDAIELLTSQRFDIAAKHLYARHRAWGVESVFARALYGEHIRAFSGGTFKEGDGSKHHLGDYLRSFGEVLDSVADRGFDRETSLVPVGTGRVVVDGSHRVAACLFHGVPVETAGFEMTANAYDSRYFRKRGLGEKWCDAIALEYCRLKREVHVAVVFPAAAGRDEEIRAVLGLAGPVVFEKAVRLNRRGALNLVAEVYRGEPWLGTLANGFPGARGKADPCFEGQGPLRVFLFECHSPEKVRQAKAAIRDLFGIGNHSVHINDRHDQALHLARLLLNRNSVHFLNHARPRYLERFQRHLDRYREWLSGSGADPERFCVDGSAVLAAYGLRDAQDLDILHHGEVDFSAVEPAINSHNGHAHHHGVARDQILFDPDFHFHYGGLKFASVDVLRAMKARRDEGKDRKDVAAMDGLSATAQLDPCHPPLSRPAVSARGRIVALVPARNEAARLPFCLRALACHADAIVYLDDCSDDNSVQVVEALAKECGVERILRKEHWDRDEPGDRNRLLEAGREIGGTHFLVLDADEAFTANWAEGGGLRCQVFGLQPGDQLLLTWIQLWRSVGEYRCDGSVWTHNMKAFAFADDGRCSYRSEFIHTPRVPADLKGRKVSVPGYEKGVLHFQFVHWPNLQIKQAWYRCLERIRFPDRPSDVIVKRYAPSEDETGLKTQRAPEAWFRRYPFLDESVFAIPDRRRVREVVAWFARHGRQTFADLDIDRVDWESLHAEVGGRSEPSGNGQRHDATGPVDGPVSKSAESAESAKGTRLADRFLTVAGRQFERGDLAGARSSLEWAHETEPDDPEILAALGGVLFQQGQFSEARRRFDEALGLRPGHAPTLTRQALTCLRLEDSEGFEAGIAAALQADPECRETLRLLADLNLGEGRHADACRWYYRLVQLDGGDLEALLGMGTSFARAGDPDAAKASYEEVLRQCPDHPVARENLRALAGPAGPDAATGGVTASREMSERPLLSAIVSTYASARFIRGCLQDLVEQTLFARGELEIVVIDSGSPEGEREVVEEYQRRHPNIVYLRTERETIYGAWNRGVKLARGKYLTSANVDDRHRPTGLERLVRALEEDPEAAVAYADVAVCETTHPDAGTPVIRGFFCWADFDRELLFRACYLGPQPVWRRALHDRYGLFDAGYVSAGDYEFWLRIAASETFVHVPEVLGLYWLSDQGVGHRDRDLTSRESDRARAAHWPADRGPLPPAGYRFLQAIPWDHRRDGERGVPSGRVLSPSCAASGVDAAAEAGNGATTGREASMEAAFETLLTAQDHLRARRFAEAESLAGQYRETVRYDLLPREDRREAGQPEISVVIVAYRTGPDLLACIESLGGGGVPSHEVILVDNGGNESVHGQLSGLALLHLRLPRNVQPSEGRNIGAQFARAPIVCFVDDDALAGAGYLEAIREAFETFEIAGLRGRVLPKSDHVHNGKAGHYDLGGLPIPADADTEGNSAFRTELYRQAGGMDPLLFGGEGVELSFRLSRKWPALPVIYWPHAVIRHDYASAEGKLERKDARHRLMKEYAGRKHPQLEAYHRRLAGFAVTDRTRTEGYRVLQRQHDRRKSARESQPGPREAAGLEPLISICIPTYNRAALLGEAVRSAIGQTYRRIEIVVVDDGSTDETRREIAQFSDPRVRYIGKEHSGGPATRNRCIAEARGEYLVWLDSDDALLPGTVERYVRELRCFPEVDVLYGHLEVVDSGMASQGTWFYQDYYGWSEALLADSAVLNRIPNVCTLVRKACYDAVGGYRDEYPRAHDYEFWTRLAPTGVFRLVPEVVGRYRRHEQSLSKLTGGADTRYEARAVQAMVERHGLRPLFPLCHAGAGTVEEGNARAWLMVAAIMLAYGDLAGACRAAREGLAAGPLSEDESVLGLLRNLLDVRRTADRGKSGRARRPSGQESVSALLDSAVRGYLDGDAGEASRAAARLTELQPGRCETLIVVGLCLQRWGDPADARMAFRELIQALVERNGARIGTTGPARDDAGAGPNGSSPVRESGRVRLAERLAGVLGDGPIPAAEIDRVLTFVAEAAAAPCPRRFLDRNRSRQTPLLFALLGLVQEGDRVPVEAEWLGRLHAVRAALEATEGGGRSGADRPRGYSFCIITHGKRPEKLLRQVASIRALHLPEYEILVAGKVADVPEGVRRLDLALTAASGRTGKLRNAAVRQARFDHVVVTDDDMRFDPGFGEGLKRFGEGYEAMAVRMLNPDGSRFWDWATVGGSRGGVLLDYWDGDPNVYITGGCCVLKAEVLDRVGWDDLLGYYQGEDVDFSRRLQAAGVVLRFNPFCTILHDDDRYTRVGRRVFRFEDLVAAIRAGDAGRPASEWEAIKEAARRVAGRDADRQRALEGLPGFEPDPQATGASGDAAASGMGASVELDRRTEGNRVRVDWHGSFLDLGSLSHVNRAFGAALGAVSELDLRLVGDVRALHGKPAVPELAEVAGRMRARPSADPRITVRHAWPPDWSRPRAGKLAVIQPWEYGPLPKDWVAQAGQVDEFWVPSEYVRRCYVESGVPAGKVHVVPNGIDPERFRPDAAPQRLATKKAYKFLFVGGTIHRKGPDILLKAYLDAFTAADDVCLVIKDFGGSSVYAGQTLEARIREVQARPGAPEILYLDSELAPEAMPGLYTACDCLVHPYRGEGFGLPVLEAMACGLPVVVTDGGATDDFARPEVAYRIPAVQTRLGNRIGDILLVDAARLLEPDPAALAQRLRWLVAHADKAREVGRAASGHVRLHWTWQRAADRVLERVRAMTQGPAAGAGDGAAVAPGQIVLPPCARLGHLQMARDLLGRRKHREAWEATLEALRLRPFHPEAYLLLAEIAQAVGDVPAARRCARHARDLVPEWKPARKFLKRLPQHGRARPQPWMVIPAEAAGAGRSRLSVCLIVRNEEEFLPACLASVRPIADQIVVVDTGSTDRTVEIAREFGAEVYAFEWCDDFSAARNAALERVTGDWVLALDADEELPQTEHGRLLAAIGRAEVIGYRLPLVNVGVEHEGVSYVPRLFRNAPGLFYVSRVHEQIFSSILVRAEEWGLETALGTAQLRHHGYRSEVVRRRGKTERNLALLEVAVQEFPGDANLLMNLGLELVHAGRLDAGLVRYAEALQALNDRPEQAQVPELREALLTQYASHLMKAGRHDDILRLLQSPLARLAPLTASLHYARALAFMGVRRFAEAVEPLRQCLATRKLPCLTPVLAEVLRDAPHRLLAQCLIQAGQPESALAALLSGLKENAQATGLRLDLARLHAAQGRPVEALQLLNELISHGCNEVDVWRLGAEIALRNPDTLAFAVDWTAEAIRHQPNVPVLAAQRAEALLLHGDPEGAHPWWVRAAAGREAGALAARVLCELALGRPASPVSAGDEPQVSRAFLEWYRRLIGVQSESPAIHAVNGRLNELARILPGAARVLESAMAEVV